MREQRSPTDEADHKNIDGLVPREVSHVSVRAESVDTQTTRKTKGIALKSEKDGTDMEPDESNKDNNDLRARDAEVVVIRSKAEVVKAVIPPFMA